MAVHVRRFSTLIAVLAVAAVLVPAGMASSRADAPAAFPTLYVVYTMDCTFTIHDDAGKRVSSIAPGTYQVYVSTPIFFGSVIPGGSSVVPMAPNDFTGCRGWVQFHLTGPGVDLETTLDFGCDAFYLMPATNFKASSSFTAQDMNQPAATRTVLTTLASGSPTIPPTPYSKTSDKGQTFKDLLGSAVAKALRGTLAGTVSANGKPTLMMRGKTVSTLKAGRYKFVITDQSPKRGFTIQAVKGKSTELTGIEFVGKRSPTVKLKAGEWMYSSGGGKAHYFRVTG